MKTTKSSQFKAFLNEGGNAIKNVSRINQINFYDTADNINKFLDELELEYEYVGSSGKKDISKNGTDEGSSGDIDIAINASKFNTFDEFSSLISNYLTSIDITFKILKGLKIISFPFPIENVDGKQEDEYVQVDLIFVPSLEYAKWSYYSPLPEDSKYPGLFRNEILFAVAKYSNYEVLKKYDNKSVEWTRMFYTLSDGLFSGKQTILGNDNKILKHPKTFDKELVTLDPIEVMNILFGDHISIEKSYTFEDLLDLLLDKRFINRENITQIIDALITGITENKKQPLPKELEVFL